MTAELFDLKDKVVLVTGGTHGIGMAVGTVLGKAGYNRQCMTPGFRKHSVRHSHVENCGKLINIIRTF